MLFTDANDPASDGDIILPIAGPSTILPIISTTASESYTDRLLSFSTPLPARAASKPHAKRSVLPNPSTFRATPNPSPLPLRLNQLTTRSSSTRESAPVNTIVQNPPSAPPSSKANSTNVVRPSSSSSSQLPPGTSMDTAIPTTVPPVINSSSVPLSSTPLSAATMTAMDDKEDAAMVEEPLDPRRNPKFVNRIALEKGYIEWLLDPDNVRGLETDKKKACYEFDLEGGEKSFRDQFNELMEGANGNEANALYIDSRRTKSAVDPKIRVLSSLCKEDGIGERQMGQVQRVEQDVVSLVTNAACCELKLTILAAFLILG